jgi:hypothetical protein
MWLMPGPGPRSLAFCSWPSNGKADLRRVRGDGRELPRGTDRDVAIACGDDGPGDGLADLGFQVLIKRPVALGGRNELLQGRRVDRRHDQGWNLPGRLPRGSLGLSRLCRSLLCRSGPYRLGLYWLGLRRHVLGRSGLHRRRHHDRPLQRLGWPRRGSLLDLRRHRRQPRLGASADRHYVWSTNGMDGLSPVAVDALQP